MNVWTLSGQETALGALALLGILLALVALARAGRPAARRQSSPGPVAVPVGGPGPELVAVIAAAVAAASGMGPGSFRITTIAPVTGQGGFNTPVWGWADRLARRNAG